MNLIKTAEQIITNNTMQLVNSDGEPISFITSETPLFCTEHFYGINFYGWNLYAVVGEKMTLLETYDDTDDITGKELCENAIQSIKNGFTAGVEYYILPSN